MALRFFSPSSLSRSTPSLAPKTQFRPSLSISPKTQSDPPRQSAPTASSTRRRPSGGRRGLHSQRRIVPADQAPGHPRPQALRRAAQEGPTHLPQRNRRRRRRELRRFRDDMFGDIDKAISMKRKEVVKQVLLKSNPKKEKGVPEGIAEGIGELVPEEVVHLEEIKKLQGLSVISTDSGSEESENEDYREAKLFSTMVDAKSHRKIGNIDDPNADFFIAQGNPDVPVVTYAIDNKNVGVHPLKFELSLFETQVLVNMPQAILEISSGLLGRHNIYKYTTCLQLLLLELPLEDIVRGIEEVDTVPGRCGLIDEEQAFGVIADYAHSPDALSRLLVFHRTIQDYKLFLKDHRDRGKTPKTVNIATLLTSDNPRSEDPLDILDDMLAGVGWTMQEYLNYGENDYSPPLPNGHRLFLHDIRRVAIRAAVATGEEGDMIVVAGKGHETYQIEGDKIEFFDDREEFREALQFIDELHRARIDTSEFPWR